MYYDDESVFDDADVDNMPVFSESRRFSRLDSYEKMLLRDYIRSCIREHREYSGRFPTENELVEIRKRAISVLEDEWHITLRNDKQWRQFFQDNAKAAIAKLQKKRRVTNNRRPSVFSSGYFCCNRCASAGSFLMRSNSSVTIRFTSALIRL